MIFVTENIVQFAAYRTFPVLLAPVEVPSFRLAR